MGSLNRNLGEFFRPYFLWDMLWDTSKTVQTQSCGTSTHCIAAMRLLPLLLGCQISFPPRTSYESTQGRRFPRFMAEGPSPLLRAIRCARNNSAASTYGLFTYSLQANEQL